MNPLLSLKNITFSYGNSRKPVFEETSFELGEIERVGLIGPNGCGKTTFLQLCIGLLKPSKGTIFFRGKRVESDSDLLELRKAIGFVFQNPDDQLFSPTVLEDVAFGPLNLGIDRERAKEIALESLELVGLRGFENRITHRLSGGEKRLLSLATVLAMRPTAMLLDEPSTGLDSQMREQIIKVLNHLNQALVIVSHDWDFVVQTTSQFYSIENRKIVKVEKGLLHQHLHYHPSGQLPHEHFDLPTKKGSHLF